VALSREQLAVRQRVVTATDLVKLAGVYPGRKGPCDVYLEKIQGDVDQEEDDQYDAADEETEEYEQAHAVQLGHMFEPLGLAALAKKRQVEVRPGVTELSERYPFLGATPDGSAIRDGQRIAVCEAKFVGPHRFYHWGWAAEQIPDYVLVQVQTQMIVCKVTIGLVVAGFGTAKRYFEVHHDDDLASTLLTVAEKFHNNHLLPRIPPKADGSPGSRALLQASWPRHSVEMIAAPEEAEALAREFIEARETEKQAIQRKNAAQQKLCALINENQGLEGQGWRATWKRVEEAVVPSYTREAYRRFDLREKKAK